MTANVKEVFHIVTGGQRLQTEPEERNQEGPQASPAKGELLPIYCTVPHMSHCLNQGNVHCRDIFYYPWMGYDFVHQS